AGAPNTLAGNPLPTCARECGHGFDVFGDDAPVHNRLCFCARHRISDIGATHHQRSANNHSKNQTHLPFPYIFAEPARPRMQCDCENLRQRPNRIDGRQSTWRSLLPQLRSKNIWSVARTANHYRGGSGKLQPPETSIEGFFGRAINDDYFFVTLGWVGG